MHTQQDAHRNEFGPQQRLRKPGRYAAGLYPPRLELGVGEQLRHANLEPIRGARCPSIHQKASGIAEQRTPIPIVRISPGIGDHRDLVPGKLKGDHAYLAEQFLFLLGRQLVDVSGNVFF